MIPTATIKGAAFQATPFEAFSRPTGAGIASAKFFLQLHIAHAPNARQFSPAFRMGTICDV
ncbi:MAG: hypothetical protein ABJM02_11245 [Paracoccaceae bacterium]